MDSIIAYTMGGCRYPCRSIEDCSMMGKLSPVIGDEVPLHSGTRVMGPDFSIMAMAYVPRETRDVEVTGTDIDPETGETKEVKRMEEREFLLLERATILTVAKVLTDPVRPYCNVAAVMRGEDEDYKSRLKQAVKEEGRRLEYTPHENIIDVMVACSVDDCPRPCSSLRSCILYDMMNTRIREMERDMRGRGFSSYSICEGDKAASAKVDSRATAYGFLDAGGSTVLNVVKVLGDEKPFCVMMVGLHGERDEERMIGAALRHILDTEGAKLGARKLV
jgi:hypothetical protein